MSKEEEIKAPDFEAPEWVRHEEPPAPLSAKQRRALTAALIVALPFCLWAGWFEFGRAENGNWRAWVYTFEWPFFGGVALYLYRRIMRGDIPRISRPDFAELAKEHEKEVGPDQIEEELPPSP